MTNWAEKATLFAVKTKTVVEKPSANGCSTNVICRCLGVTTEEIDTALNVFNAESVQDLKQQTGAGSGCTACHRMLRQILAARAEQPLADRCTP